MYREDIAYEDRWFTGRMRSRILVAGLVLLVGCADQPASDSVSEYVDPTEIVDDVSTSGIAWIDWGLVFTDDSTPLVVGGERLWVATLTGRDPEELDGTHRGCARPDLKHPSPAGTEALGIVVTCQRDDLRREFSIARLNGRTGNPDVLSPVDFSPARIAMSPSLERAIVSRSDELCSGLAMVTRSGVQEFPVWVGSGSQRFRVDADFGRLAGTGSCSDWGLADWPAWSPDGRRVAFFASPESVGREGFEKAESSWNLHVMDAPTDTFTSGSANPALEGIRFPRDPAFSPDGKLLVFSGEIGAQRGMWLFRIADRDLRLLSTIETIWHAWSPDGEEIAAVEPLRPEVLRQRIVTFELLND